jgi:hypothetical protein
MSSINIEATAEIMSIPLDNDMTLRAWYNYPADGLHLEVQVGFGEGAYTSEPVVLKMKQLRFLASSMEAYAQAGGL